MRNSLCNLENRRKDSKIPCMLVKEEEEAENDSSISMKPSKNKTMTKYTCGMHIMNL